MGVADIVPSFALQSKTFGDYFGKIPIHNDSAISDTKHIQTRYLIDPNGDHLSGRVRMWCDMKCRENSSTVQTSTSPSMRPSSAFP